MVSLRDLSKTCKFCTEECTRKNIRDQIIKGLLEGDTVEDLLRERDLSLDTAISKCRAQEAARKQRADITSGLDGAQIHVVGKRQPENPTDRPQRPCAGCGYPPHPGGRQNCPAFGLVCRKCRGIGHFGRVCQGGRKSLRGAPRPPPYVSPCAQVVQVDQPVDQHFPRVNASAVADIFEPAPTILIGMSALNGSCTLPDSGADISVAGLAMLECLNEHPDNLLSSSVTPRAVNGSTMSPIGKLPLSLTLSPTEYTDEFHIYPQVKGAFLSWKAARGLKILPESYPHPPTPVTPPCVSVVEHAPPPPSDEIMAAFPSIFDGQVKSMEGEEFHIQLVDGAQPFCVHTPRTIPFAYREKLQDELTLLQSQGIIAPVTTPTEWCAPIVVTPKKDSDRIRLCVDLSRLNKYVRRERYQSPSPAQAVADIAAEEAKVFTKLDALKGYHQCPLAEASQLLTTFITPFGRFKFLRAPYGISSISEHYNRRMDEAFVDLKGYRRIVDDVVIFDRDTTLHASHVKKFIQRCVERQITLNTDKWVYARPEVDFEGFHLSGDGYSIDNSIVTAISRFPQP